MVEKLKARSAKLTEERRVTAARVGRKLGV
jgi:hypothetical protein